MALQNGSDLARITPALTSARSRLADSNSPSAASRIRALPVRSWSGTLAVRTVSALYKCSTEPMLGEHWLELALERGGDDLVQERRIVQPPRDHLEESAHE